MFKRLTALFSIPSYGLLFLCMLLQGMGISLSAPFLSIYFTEQLGVSVGLFGVFLATTLIAGIWISTLIGRRSDLGLNRRNIYLVSTLCNALAYSGYLLIGDFTILFIYMIVFTALGAPGMPQLFAIAREAVNKSDFTDTAFANSTLRSAFSLGFITGPLIGTLLIAAVGFKGIFSGTIGVFLLVALLISLFLKSNTEVKSSTAEVKVKSFRLGQNRNVLLPFLIMILMYVAHWTSSINTALFITNNLGGTTSDVGLVSSICAALEIPFMIMLGLLSAKYSNRILMMCGAILGGAYYLVVITSGAMWQMLAAQILLAFFVAVISAIGISYIQDLLPNMPGYASTLYSNSSTIGRLIGSLVGGLLASVVGYRYSFVLCFILVIISTIMLAVSGRYSVDDPQKLAI
ncbi:MFS transporter [Paenibacillus odorifer]|uniref:sugar efflux transporter n=1 Tax=Paenibacillus TaxID=44249 RepID=UPI00096C67B1|nr:MULTISPECIES: sugar efflux transporter [Paenibacillus]MDH6430830.1 SET family sugar efflux transporter-like MFS transporter [Paenibacillus sp. PastH-4]MDH6446734.1 SET family sugar efflux transporter-like MFS transporter [Paenibacillus sp. PastF-4]MDH6531182.1 SET family sugar efflux transporter-like MFS transporter [Paenibacillus sp. PastH-3]OMD59864.1 MFS transporter [Paenibacillus odorifer]OMD91326.1 MFS transporter [Paenibacillus odorifer]